MCRADTDDDRGRAVSAGPETEGNGRRQCCQLDRNVHHRTLLRGRRGTCGYCGVLQTCQGPEMKMRETIRHGGSTACDAAFV